MKCAFIDLGKDFGGAENYLFTLIKKWIQVGNEAIIIVRSNSKFEETLLNSELKSITYGVSFNCEDIIKIKKLLLSKKIDVLHINGINSGVFSSLMNLNIRKITTVHSNAVMDRVNKPKIIQNIFLKLENWNLNKSSKIIVVSKEIERLLVSRGVTKDKIVFIPNGVEKINYPKKQYRKDAKQTLKICYVGRLEKVKGCEYLILALQELREINYICDIYGDGSCVNDLKEIARKCDDKIRFMGFSRSIREDLTKYDVLVLPSLYEAFPLTILEAMNARVLLVCSDVGGIPYIIEDGENGYLFKAKQINELTDLVRKIYYNPLDQISIVEKAYNYFISNYTENIMLEKTITVLEGMQK